MTIEERDALDEEALKMLGWPFADGGRGPEGIDCFGVAQRLARAQGVELPDLEYDDAFGQAAGAALAENWWRHAIEIAREDLDHGDILFFKMGAAGAVGHLGVYLGRGRFVHGSRAGVRIERLDGQPWRRRLAFCARLRPGTEPRMAANAYECGARAGRDD